MNIYLDIVKEDKKDVLYRLLEYSLYEESANDLNEMKASLKINKMVAGNSWIKENIKELEKLNYYKK